jgi:hypothetical protein
LPANQRTEIVSLLESVNMLLSSLNRQSPRYVGAG